MKASQAISSEIELEQLLHTLMQILIENSGAQTGCLILKNAGTWAIEAACELNDGEKVCATRVLQSLPTTNRLPESIIQYVIRTREPVILNDATHEGNFINEPYIQHHQTQSLLCLPLLNQSKLVGVLYLENQLAVGAFTPERFSEGDATRSQVLNLLSTQAAIAIENAKLYSKLRASESQMAQFLEAIPVGIAAIDATGCPYYANQRGIHLMGKGIDPAVPPDQIAEAYQFYVTGTDQIYPTEKMPIIRALSGERTTIDDVEIRQNNQTIPVEVWGTPVFDEQGNVVYAIAAFQDITERKQAEDLLANYNRTLEQQVAQRTVALQQSEAALRHQEQELRLIADALPALISYVDANCCYQFINLTYEIWFNCSRDEILGKPVHGLFGETVDPIFEPSINQVFEGQTVALEAEIPSSLGTRCISATLIPDFDHNAQVRGFYSLITDISEQRNAALRERKRAEQASILEERNRMAREIHDTLAQSFTGILLQVGATTQVLPEDIEATQVHLEMIDELARTGLAEARRSVAALRPQLLEEGNLHSALHRLVTQMRASANTDVTYQIKGTAYPMPAEVENNLLRIAQEALTNAIKYADAGKIRVELVYENAQCVLRVKDDGRGFGVSSIPDVGGFGLLGMSERAETKFRSLVLAQDAYVKAESEIENGNYLFTSIDKKINELVNLLRNNQSELESLINEDMLMLETIMEDKDTPKITKQFLEELLANQEKIHFEEFMPGTTLSKEGIDKKYTVKHKLNQAGGTSERLGSLTHEITHVSVSEIFENTPLFLAFKPGISDEEIQELCKQRKLYVEQLENIYKDDDTFSGKQKQLLENKLNYAKGNKLEQYANTYFAAKKIDKTTKDEIMELAQQSDNSVIEYDTVINQMLIYMHQWNIPSDNQFYKKLIEVAEQAYKYRHSR